VLNEGERLTAEDNEETVNDLIAVIWPLLDKGIAKDEIKAMVYNVMDSWSPKHETRKT
jgi:hypothetical protein